MATANTNPGNDGGDEGGEEWRAVVSIDDADTEEDETTRKLRATLAVAGSDRVRVKLYKLDPKAKGGRVWCSDYSPDEYENGGMAMVREQWGAGDYELRIINSQGVAGKTQFTIAAPLVPIPVAGGAAPQNDALRMVLDQQTRILEALTARPDPQQEMMRTLSLMTAMRDAMGVNPAPAVNPMTMFSEMLAMVREAKSAAKDLVGEEPPVSDNPMAMLPQLLDTVKTVVTQQSQQPVAPPAQLVQPIAIPATVQRAQVPAPPVDENPAPAVSANDAATEAKEIRKLRASLALLVSMAECGDDAEDGASLVLEQLPDELLDHLGNAQWFELLTQFSPGVAPHREWITKVRDRVLQILAEESSDDDGDDKSPGPAAK